MEKQDVDAKAAELREKLNDESLDKCKVAGGGAGAMDTEGPAKNGWNK